MPAKDLLFEEEARSKLKEGIDVLANTVKKTLGPRGQNVIVDKKFGPAASQLGWRDYRQGSRS